MSDDRWGCPDWRIMSDYPNDPEFLKDWQWKWEFLRRVPSYRESWLIAEPLEAAYESYKLPKARRLSLPEVRWAYRQIYGIEEIYDPSVHFSETRPFFWCGRGSLSLPPREYFETGFFEEEGLDELTDKEKITYLLKYFESLGLLECEPPYPSHFIPNENDVFQWLFEANKRFDYWAIDRSVPIGLQKREMNEYLALLKRVQDSGTPQLSKSSRTLWARHLRVIDAKDQGASHSEIFNQFVHEWSGGDARKLDEFYRPPEPDSEKKDAFLAFAMGNPNADKGKRRAATQPRALVSQWHKQAIDVMEKAARFL